MKQKKKIAIQGIKGAFHEEAARNYFGEPIEIVPCNEFEDELMALKNSEVDYALMAIENSISGTILNNYELIRNANVKIVGEVRLQIRQQLGGLPGTRIEQLTEVSSHYMALNQCREFFKEFPQINLVEAQDTAMSVKDVAVEKKVNRGAIGSMVALKEYGLEVLASDIHSHKDNFTRFVVVANKSVSIEGDKISLSVILKHESGALSKLLYLISLIGANLTKIESVPIENEPFRYRFYMDVVMDEDVSYKSTIEILKPQTEELTVLGRYNHEPLIIDQ